jgi:hypothetical protein
LNFSDYLLFLFLEVLGFELGFMLMRQAVYHISHISSPFCSFFFFLTLPAAAGMISMCHHTQLFFSINGVAQTCPCWPGTAILPISTSQIARITCMSHWCPTSANTFNSKNRGD